MHRGFLDRHKDIVLKNLEILKRLEFQLYQEKNIEFGDAVQTIITIIEILLKDKK